MFEELKRRNVVRVGTAYAVVAWVLAQVAEFAFENFAAPDWALKTFVVVLLLGLPVALFLAWAFEITPEGVKREEDVDRSKPGGTSSGQKLNALIIGGLVVALAYAVFTRQPAPSTAPPAIPQESQADRQGSPDSEAKLRSIAVLPFVNRSPDPANEYLSDGITEEILNALARVPGLRVPARTSTFMFKGRTEDIKKIGELLRVEHVLEGSVQKIGDQLRVSVQLVNISDGFQLWSEKYDEKMTNIFDIQDKIASNIVTKLELTMSGVTRPGTTSQARNVDAYDAYLKGRFYAEKYAEPDLRRAIAYFEEALKQQPDYARAYAGLGYTYGSLRYFGHVPPATVTPQYRATVAKAIELDDTLADAHFSLALLRYNADWDWAGSEQEFKRALQLDPANAWARGLYGFLLATTGRFTEALTQVKIAKQLDPISSNATAQLGWIAFFMQDYATALTAANQAIELEPDFPNAHELLGYTLFRQGNKEAGIAAMERAVELADFPIVLGNLGWMYGRVGRTVDAQAMLTTLLARANETYVPAAPVASVYRGLQDYAQADLWMSKAIADREGILVLLDIGFGIDEIDRAQPGYSRWRAQIGLPQP